MYTDVVLIEEIGLCPAFFSVKFSDSRNVQKKKGDGTRADSPRELFTLGKKSMKITAFREPILLFVTFRSVHLLIMLLGMELIFACD